MGKLLAQCIRSRWIQAICLAAVLAALVLPVTGFGVPLCQFRVMTGLPCPACGLTRSFIHSAHLDLVQAAFFHPAGVLAFPVVLFLAGMLAARRPVLERLATRAERRGILWNVYSGVVLAVFVINGVGRIAWLLLTRTPSPW